MKKNIFWPDVDDLWSAKKACIQASGGAILVGIITAIITYMHLKGTSIIAGISAGNFLDAAVFLVLGFFIHRCSRIATLVAFVIYIYGQVLMFQQEHRMPTMAIFLSLFLLGGIRGAFSFHGLKQGMSKEEVKATLKTQKEATEPPPPSLAKRITAWTVLIVLAGGGYWLYKNSQSHPDSHVAIQDSSSAFSGETMVTAKAGSANLPTANGERVFKMKDGSTISGRVILDDPVYYTVETSGGRQEVVIKADISE